MELPDDTSNADTREYPRINASDYGDTLEICE